MVRRTFLAALPSFACCVVLLAAGNAYATCGDWLQHEAKPASKTGADDRVSAAENNSTDRLPAAPCRGGECDRGPAHPAAPIPADVSFGPAKSALQVSIASLPGGTDVTSFAGEASVMPTDGFPMGVYHPPRA